MICFLEMIKPSSILDVGVGNGKIGFIARDLLDVMLGERYRKQDWQTRIDGIELFAPYIQDHQKAIYDTIYIGDAHEIIDTLGNYDLIIAGDVLEHFEKEKAWQFLDKCAVRCNKYIILNLPLGEGWHQPDIYGNPHERHLSVWTYDELVPFVTEKELFFFQGVGEYGCFLIKKEDYLLYRQHQNDTPVRTAEANNTMDDIIRELQNNPDNAGAYYNLGVVFQSRGETDKALKCYGRAVSMDPTLAEAHYNMGTIVKEKGDLQRAVELFRTALQHKPDFFEACYNLANTLKESRLLEEAVQTYERALLINPLHTEAHNNLGVALHDRQQPEKAVDSFRQALHLDPAYAKAHWNLSLALLLDGKFNEGWREYEWRWKTGDIPCREYYRPLWDGTVEPGRTVLIHAEQGFGDTIQFIRYAPLVAAKGIRVIIECQPELTSLLSRVEGVHEVVAAGAQLPAFDFHCPLLSLPLLFDTTLDTIPSQVPYLYADPLSSEAWRSRLKSDGEGIKIGLAWSGRHPVTKSCPPEALASLMHPGSVILYCLQKGDDGLGIVLPERLSIIDHTTGLRDFSDTAALIENLDLVISVDTAVAHLAGAMGKAVWLLLPFEPDWRWLMGREDSPWYPTMKLFRQPSPGAWAPVISRIAGELDKILANR
jgi:tetratricopeptide (TPR) repeat protein